MSDATKQYWVEVYSGHAAALVRRWGWERIHAALVNRIGSRHRSGTWCNHATQLRTALYGVPRA